MPAKQRLRMNQEQLAELDDSPWDTLARAVVAQACRDWRLSVRKLTRLQGRGVDDEDRRVQNAKRRREDCERFFRSKWIAQLTTVDPEYILERLYEEAGECGAP